MSVSREAKRVAGLLKLHQRKVVFAESCTGGLVSGALTRIAGISEYHCGGMIVYRDETKVAYLEIPAAVLKHSGPVSRAVTAQLAEHILLKTPEADLSGAVTGHLGPNAPQRLDGVVFLCIAGRNPQNRPVVLSERRNKYAAGTSRRARQQQTIEDLLRLLGDVLSHMAPQ